MQPESLEQSIVRTAEYIRNSSHVVSLVGAGLSAESGIPTFRGKDGIWTKFGEPTIDGWELFRRDPAAWWENAILAREERSEFSVAIEIAEPNAGHLGMAALEEMGRLAHIITQNIDNLHQKAGSKAITEIHGNRFKVRCMNCNGRDLLARISLESLPPLCPECGGVLKNDTVMFGEPIRMTRSANATARRPSRTSSSSSAHPLWCTPPPISRSWPRGGVSHSSKSTPNRPP